jgi:hypothetical protein
MVASISFSGRECRHADEIFAFPARTEFSVTTGVYLFRLAVQSITTDIGVNADFSCVLIKNR